MTLTFTIAASKRPQAPCFGLDSPRHRRHVKWQWRQGRNDQSHHRLQSYPLRRIMTTIMKTTHHFLARVGQVNKATLAT